eukprot:COSAG06_NODE_6020_length_3149_cov_3.621639_2_plen_55_part_00
MKQESRVGGCGEPALPEESQAQEEHDVADKAEAERAAAEQVWIELKEEETFGSN